mgnify:CR=1 FL=1
MPAGTAFPTWAYNLTQPAQLVQTQAALTALGSSWSTTPFAPTPPDADVEEVRQKQILIETRIMNLLLKEGFNIKDEVDGTGLRADVLANDSSLTS